MCPVLKHRDTQWVVPVVVTYSGLAIYFTNSRLNITSLLLYLLILQSLLWANKKPRLAAGLLYVRGDLDKRPVYFCEVGSV